MDVTTLLVDALSRIPGAVGEAIEDLDVDALGWRPAPDANPIGWLVWHLTRVQDAQIAPLAGVEEIWTRDGWADRFDVPAGTSTHGYGWTPEQVGQLQVRSVKLLLDHLAVVNARCRELVAAFSPADLDRVVDESWSPPVTAGVRLVSVVDDVAQHTGQVGYVRGLYDQRER
ncbi:MAG: DUF664 domain-containing protein [Nitriliruptor sp.]